MKKIFVVAILMMVILPACGALATPIAVPTAVPPTAVPPTATEPPAPPEVNMTFVNESTAGLDYFWVSSDTEEKYGTIEGGSSLDQSTYEGDVWRVRDLDGNLVMEYAVTQDASQTVTIGSDAVAAADPLASALQADVQKFKDDGRISTTDGDYIRILDFKESFAQLGWYQSFLMENLEVEKFVYSAHFKWSTAADTSDLSGCGIVFANQASGNYAVFLDKSRVYFTSSSSTSYRELGKTSGTGRLSFGNPSEADMSLVVSENRAFVYVNDEFIGEYSLATSKPLKGGFGYAIISGTNKDAGTTCEITKAGIWSLK